MTPEQIQQLSNSTFWEMFRMMPWWIEGFYLLIVLATVTTTLCLPLIVWKLFSYNKPPKTQTSLTADQIRLQKIRDRREALLEHAVETLHKAEQPQPESPTDFSASGAGVPEPIQDDSRYLPQ